MTLDYIFENYTGDKLKFYRRRHLERFKKRCPELEEEFIKKDMYGFDLEFLKFIKAFGNQRAANMGFLIPGLMVADANADDWELQSETTEE